MLFDIYIYMCVCVCEREREREREREEPNFTSMINITPYAIIE